MEVFSTNDLAVASDYSKTAFRLLNDLIKEKFLIGLSSEDVKKISTTSKARSVVLFVGKDCPDVKQRGWSGFGNSVWVDFETPLCPVR